MDKTPRHTFSRAIGIVFAACVVLTVLLLAAAPTLISTSWGQKKLLSFINGKIPGKVNAKHLELHWFGPQIVDTAQLNDSQEQVVATLNHLQIDSSLFSILLNHGVPKNLHLQGLNITLEEDGTGITNLHRAIQHLPASQTDKKFAITLSDVNGEMDLQKTGPVQIYFEGNTLQDNLKGNFDVEILLANRHELQIDNLKANVANFPVILLDNLVALKKPQTAGLIHSLLGETLNLTLNHSQQNQFTLSIQSPQLTMQTEGRFDRDLIVLTKPAETKLTIDPIVVKKLLEDYGNFLGVELLKPTQTTLIVKQLEIPTSLLRGEESSLADAAMMAQLTLAETSLKGIAWPDPVTLRDVELFIQAPKQAKQLNCELHGRAIQNGKSYQLQLSATADKPKTLDHFLNNLKEQNAFVKGSVMLPPTHLEAVPYLGAVQIANIEAYVEGSPFKLLHANLQGALIAESKEGALLLGSDAKIAIKSDLHYAGAWEANPLNATLTSQNLTLTCTARADSDQNIAMLSPLEVVYTVSPDYFSALTNSQLKLLQPAECRLGVKPFNFNLKELSGLFLSGSLTATAFTISNSANEQLSITQLYAPWQLDLNNDNFKVDLTAKTGISGKTQGGIAAFLLASELRSPDDKVNISTKINLTQFPSSLLTPWTKDDNAELLLGKSINLEIDASSTLPADHGHLSLKLLGDQVALDAIFKIQNGNAFSEPGKPTTLVYNMTPERFQALRASSQEQMLHLLEPVNIRCTIHSFQIPLKALDLASTRFSATLAINEAKIVNKLKQSKVVFENVVANFDTDNLHKNLIFKVSGNERDQNEKYELKLNGQLEQFLTDSFAINTDALTLQLELRSPRLPSSLVCQLSGIDDTYCQKLEALLGDTIDTDIDIRLKKMNGPVQAQLKGNNGRIMLDARVDDGILSLNSPFEAEIKVTPQFARSIIQDVLPVLSGIIGADQPVKVRLEPTGFALPLRNLQLDQISIGKGMIALGKLWFSGEGTLGSIFELLGPTSQGKLSVWFTPLYFKMDHGSIKLSRLDMLLMDRFPIALWGKVSPVKDKVDIRIGLTGAAISRAFNVAGLDNEYIMQLPLTGTLDNASINKAKAVTRITSLIAQSKGSPEGVLLGTVLGLAGGELTEDPAPAPTTNPLPWDLNVEKGKQAKNEQKSSKKNKKDKDLIEEVGSAASGLINNLLK